MTKKPKTETLRLNGALWIVKRKITQGSMITYQLCKPVKKL